MTYPKTSVLISLHIPSEACQMIKIISKCEILRSEVLTERTVKMMNGCTQHVLS